MRVIYYWAISVDQILLLHAYAKNVKADLTQGEIRQLRQIVADEYP